jgi:hypothetical protein
MIIEGTYGQVVFQDSSQNFPAQKFDLTFWDPPYNIEFGQSPFCKHGKQYDSRGAIVPYADSKGEENYIQFLRGNISTLKIMSKCLIVHCGYNNEMLWFKKVECPDFTLTHYVVNPKSGGLNCHLRNRLPMLGFGKPVTQFNTDIFKDVVKWGFVPHEKYLHPCPMNAQFLMDLISQSGARSVYDPMAGSGAIPEACETLGIPYYATELKEEYAPDIQYRIQKGQKAYAKIHSEQKITAWCK